MSNEQIMDFMEGYSSRQYSQDQEHNLKTSADIGVDEQGQGQGQGQRQGVGEGQGLFSQTESVFEHDVPALPIVPGSDAANSKQVTEEATNAEAAAKKSGVFSKPNKLKVATPAHVTPTACVQTAGDVVIVPESWSHGVLNIQQSVAIATEAKANLWRLKTGRIITKIPSEFDNNPNSNRKGRKERQKAGT